MKEVKKIGYVNPESEHQSGLVVSRGGYYHPNIQYSGKTRQRQYGKLIILGGIGRNEREDRDSMRVLSGKGDIYALKAHIDKEPPLFVKRYEKRK